MMPISIRVYRLVKLAMRKSQLQLTMIMFKTVSKNNGDISSFLAKTCKGREEFCKKKLIFRIKSTISS